MPIVVDIDVMQARRKMSVGDRAEPVLQRLVVVAPERLPGLLHLDQHPGLPDAVGERGPRAFVRASPHAGFQHRAGLRHEDLVVEMSVCAGLL